MEIYQTSRTILVIRLTHGYLFPQINGLLRKGNKMWILTSKMPSTACRPKPSLFHTLSSLGSERSLLDFTCSDAASVFSLHLLLENEYFTFSV